MSKSTELTSLREEKSGFTLYFDNDKKEHFLFSPEIAKALALNLLEAVRLQESSPTGFFEDVSVSDFCRVKIKGGKTTH